MSKIPAFPSNVFTESTYRMMSYLSRDYKRRTTFVNRMNSNSILRPQGRFAEGLTPQWTGRLGPMALHRSYMGATQYRPRRGPRPLSTLSLWLLWPPRHIITSVASRIQLFVPFTNINKATNVCNRRHRVETSEATYSNRLPAGIRRPT